MISSADGNFWAKVDREGPKPELHPRLGRCWIWMAGKNKRGYGRYSVWRDRKAYLAHRFAYERSIGPVPKGLELDHLCMNPACVRPSHLEAVTHRENNRRAEAVTHQAQRRAKAKIAAGILPPAWALQRSKTHCPQGHPYDEANTTHRRGRRHCKACQRARYHRNKHRWPSRATVTLAQTANRPADPAPGGPGASAGPQTAPEYPGYPRSFVNSRPEPDSDPPTQRPRSR